MVKSRRKMLVSVESTDKFDSSTIAFDCSDEEFRSIEAGVAQNESKRTAENSATDKRTEGIRSMACDREKVWSKEHAGQKFSICSTDQQHKMNGTEQKTWSSLMTS